MKREEKNTIIDNIVQQIQGTKHFYLTDIAALNAEATSKTAQKVF